MGSSCIFLISCKVKLQRYLEIPMSVRKFGKRISETDPDNFTSAVLCRAEIIPEPFKI